MPTDGCNLSNPLPNRPPKFAGGGYFSQASEEIDENMLLEAMPDFAPFLPHE